MKLFNHIMLAVVFITHVKNVCSVKTLQALTQKKVVDYLVENKTGQLISGHIKEQNQNKSDLKIIECVLPKECINDIKQEIVDRKYCKELLYPEKLTLYQEIGRSIKVPCEKTSASVPQNVDSKSCNLACKVVQIDLATPIYETRIRIFDTKKKLCIKLIKKTDLYPTTILHEQFTKNGNILLMYRRNNLSNGKQVVVFDLTKFNKAFKKTSDLSFTDTLYLYQFFLSYLQKFKDTFKTNKRKEKIMQQLTS